MAWGDISSDEEEEAPPPVVAAAAVAPPPPAEEDPPPAPRQHHKPRPREIPDEPPFTAYLGNLSYQITQEDDLVQALQDLVAPQTLSIVHVRIVKDHGTGKPRGFAYVQVERQEQLRMLMDLPEPVEIKGRRLQLDTANPPKGGRGKPGGSFRGGNSAVDGSKFQGGSFAKREEGESSSPKQRPSLLLKPRSGREKDGGSESNLNASSSSIFGGGKARDELSWRDRSKEETKTPPAENSEPAVVSPVNKDGKPTTSTRSPSGRTGGRGRTEGGRGRGEGNSRGRAEGGRGREGHTGGRGDGGKGDRVRRPGRGRDGGRGRSDGAKSNNRAPGDGGKGRGEAKRISTKATKSQTYDVQQGT